LSRADFQTYTQTIPELFDDFLTNLDVSPVTGNVAVVTNEDAVKLRMYNIVMTNLLERPYNPDFGSKVNSILFEPFGDIAKNSLDTTIRAAIKNNEPAATIARLDIIPSISEDAYRIDLYFTMINIPDQTFYVPIILKRAR